MVERCEHSLQATSFDGGVFGDFSIVGAEAVSFFNRFPVFQKGGSVQAGSGCASFWCLSASSSVAETYAHSLQATSPEGRRLDDTLGIWGTRSSAVWDRL